MASSGSIDPDPFATIRSSSSNRKAGTILPTGPGAKAARRAPNGSTSSSSAASSPHLRASSPTPSTHSVASSSSSNGSSFKRRRTSVESVTTDWTGSLPRNSHQADPASSRRSGEGKAYTAGRRSGTLLPTTKTDVNAKNDINSTVSSRSSRTGRMRVDEAAQKQRADAVVRSHASSRIALGTKGPSVGPHQRWSTWTADSTLHSESVWGCNCQSHAPACEHCGPAPQNDGPPLSARNNAESSQYAAAYKAELASQLLEASRKLSYRADQDTPGPSVHKHDAQRTMRPLNRTHSRSRSISSNIEVDADSLPTGDTTLFSNASAALQEVRTQLSHARAAGVDGEAAADEESEGEVSDASTDPAQRAAFEALFRATVSALEQSNALLLSTLNSRSQLASLRAQQGAVERDMNSRELDLRRRLEANQSMADWVRESAEQLEGVVRELDAERLRAAGGVAVSGGWGFSRPTHWRVPSLGGLGSVFGGGEGEAASDAASPDPAAGPANGIHADDEGNLTIGKTAAKRLERVLIKHKRGQSSLSIASSMQSQVGHARNASVASSRLDPSAMPIIGATGSADVDGKAKSTSPASSPLAKVLALSEESPEVDAPPQKVEKNTDEAREAVPALGPSPIPNTPGKLSAPPRSSKLMRPGKAGLGLRIAPSAPITATVVTAALPSPTVVVSPSQNLDIQSGQRPSLSAARRTESRASLTSIDEGEGDAPARSPRVRYPLGASTAAPASSPTVDRASSPALSIHLGAAAAARRTPSQRGSISSLNSISSVRSERIASTSVTGSPAGPRLPRALAVTASAPASRLEVPTILSAPLPAWSTAELGVSGLPETGGGMFGGGAQNTLSALLSRSPSTISRAGSEASTSAPKGTSRDPGLDGSKTDPGAVDVRGDDAASERADGDGDGDGDESGLEDDGQYAAYIHGAKLSTESGHAQPGPSVHSPIAVDSRRLSSQSNASKLSAFSTANLRSPRLARLDSNTASALAAQASAELASGWTADGSRLNGGADGLRGLDGRLGVGGGGGGGGGGRGRGALAALKRLNEQKGVLPGGPEMDGLTEAGSGGSGGGGAWASITSWVGLGLGGGSVDGITSASNSTKVAAATDDPSALATAAS